MRHLKIATFFAFHFSLFFASCQNPNDKKLNDQNEPIQWFTLPGKSEIKKNKKIVLVSGDEEYRSEEMLPQLAKILSTHHGFDCTVLFSQNPEKPGVVDPNFTRNIPGLHILGSADLMILFTRFRALPDDQMQFFKKYLQAGKPIIGIRTATHAFNFQDSLGNYFHWGNYSKSEDTGWHGGFGQKILGTNWHTHHGHHKHQSTRGILAPDAESHPVTQNIQDGAIWGPTDVYGLRLPYSEDIRPLVLGQVVNRAGEFDENDLFFGMRDSDSEIATVNPATEKKYNPNEPMMPIVWEKPYQISGGENGKAITSTIGASSDFLNEELRRVLVNSVYYLLDMPVPKNANVELIGKYEPSQFNFHDDKYWDEKNTRVSDYLDVKQPPD